VGGVRENIARRLSRDLVGPREASEVLKDRATDVYLTGILFPPRSRTGPEEDDDADSEGGTAEAGSANEAVATANTLRPSTAGISFALGFEREGVPAVDIRIKGGTYAPIEEEPDADADDAKRRNVKWARTDHIVWIKELIIEEGSAAPVDLSNRGLPGLWLHTRASRWGDHLLVTVVVSNESKLSAKPTRAETEEHCFFQIVLCVKPSGGSWFVPRPDSVRANDPDGRAAALIYRDAHEYAVGHLCSATWAFRSEQISSVRTTWLPTAVVDATSADGDPVFEALRNDPNVSPFSAQWLSEVGEADLADGLTRFANAYASWIEARQQDVPLLPSTLQAQAQEHLGVCGQALSRIENGIALLRDDENARAAFRLANRAMLLQRQWNGSDDLVWRPFQLAFFLLAARSSVRPEDAHREAMDLLWFPTGGGKTEAYLLLTAFVLFYRRLSQLGVGAGGGVAVLMRYTLRLLTIQQYERAAAVICACELIRSGGDATTVELSAAVRKAAPITLGLWVGDASTPNTVDAAADALRHRGSSTPAQLKDCPCCRKPLTWKKAIEKQEIWAICPNTQCDVAAIADHLPIWTVDEDVYRELPSLLIGTGDKFAQITRKTETGRLFGLATGYGPPDLIIQDELHLISGPLGTMAGIYEVAIDELCSRSGSRPKVIGSTATIRRAEDQIRALFDRSTFQFPPPGLDHRNSGFSVAADPDRQPGRLYVGVTTAGRSAKFTLQAVAASLLQAAAAPQLSDKDRDPYWSLVTYFNSLRELGGALVLMQDDVTKTAEEFAIRRGETPRSSFAVTELTSRVDSSEIPVILGRLNVEAPSADAVDIVLASNMISVGVDVPRLGLMVVNGQPKSIAEYIQATSRVGRGSGPGLVVTVFNANKARDRSHYETFRTWHQTLYRDVEATSVTPFAARARDRALHAPFVAIARHLISGLKAEPFDAEAFRSDLEQVIDVIVMRAERVDPAEAAAVRQYLERKLDQWCRRGVLQKYWNDYRPRESLLMSAETAAERAANNIQTGAAWATPNSLRSVEAAVEFRLADNLERTL
jgi:hypothetical protein